MGTGDQSKEVLLQQIAALESKISKQEQLLKEKERNCSLFKTLEEKSSEVITLIGRGGKVIHASPSAYKILGYHPASLVNERFEDFLHPDDQSAFSRLLSNSLATPGKTMAFSARHSHISGRYIWCEGFLTNQTDDPVIQAFVLNFRDVTGRKLVEDRMMESEERFSTVFEKLPIALGISRQVDQKIVLVNEAFAHLFGYKRSEIIGKTTEELDLWHIPEDRIKFQQALSAKKEEINFETIARIHSGELRNVIISGVIIEVDKEPCFVAQIVDITDRIQAEHKLTESEKRFSDAIDNLIEGCQIISNDWRYVYMNDAAVAQAQMSREQMLNRTMMECFPGIEKTAMFTTLEKAMNEKVPLRITNEFSYNDGSKGWFDLFISPFKGGLFILSENITVKKTAQEALLKSEERYRKLAENLPDTTIVFLDRDFRLTFVTGQNARNGSEDSPAGHARSARELFSPEAMDNLKPIFVKAFEGQTGSMNIETNGAYFNVMAVPVYGSHGKIPEIQVISQNITERITSEKLRSQWADAFFNCGHGIVIVLPETNTILTCNQAFAESQGYSIEEMTSKPVIEMHIPEMRTCVKERVAEADRTGHVQFESVMNRKDGSIFPVLIDIVSVTDQSGHIIYRVGTQQDITERKKAEEERRASERKLKIFVEFAPAAIAMFDNDMNYIAVSKRYLTDFNLNENNITGRSHYEIFPEMDDARKAIHRRCLAGAIEKCEEDRLIRMDGSVEWVKWEIRPWYENEKDIGGILFFSEVITERKKAEEKIRESELRFSKIFHSSPIGISLVHLASGTQTAINEACVSIFGYQEEEVLNQTSIDLQIYMNETDRDAFIGQLIKEGHVHEKEIQIVRKNKEKAILQASAEVISIDNDQYAMVLFSDITERKMAEEKLRASEEKYRYLFEKNSQPMWVFEIATKKFLAVNHAAIEKYGYTREEFLNMDISKIRKSSDVERLDRFMDTNVSEYTFAGEWQHLLKNGEIIDVEIYSHTIDFDNKKAKLVVVYDVTEKKKAQTGLIESEEKFRQIAENIQDVFWMSDPKINKIFYISPAYRIVWGKEPQNLYDHPESFLESIVPEDRPKYLQAVEWQSGGWATNIEYRITTASGEVRNILDSGFPVLDENGQVIRRVGVAKDITIRKKQEEEIKRLSIAVEQSSASIFITDLDANIIYANDALLEHTGYNREELIGQSPAVFKSGKVKTAVYEELWKTIKSGVTWKGILVNRKKNGELFWESTSITPLLDEQEHIMNYLAVKLDITKEKQAEQKIRKINEELEQKVISRTAQLMDANLKLNDLVATKDKFFSIIAHDLKNPFNSILSFSQLLIMSYDQMEINTIKKSIGNINRSAETAYRLLENLLEWARSQTGNLEYHPEETELQEIIQTARHTAENIAQHKNIRIETGQVDQTTVYADKNMIHTIIRNLISNAIKFTPEGGTIFLSGASGADYATLTVRDTGIGMEAGVLKKLFKISEKVTQPGTNNEQGTGLGLILCKEFTERNGGKIWVESEPGKGSAFHFTLPLNPPAITG